MTIEITSAAIHDGTVIIWATDCSEENLQRMERTRDDGAEEELEFIFDTRVKQEQKYLWYWLRRQKAAQEAKTWGEAINAVVGTITDISGRYRSWDR